MYNGINNFEDYGFTANFTGEILKEVDDYYVGYAYDEEDFLLSVQWDKKGNSHNGFDNEFKLKPVPKPWFLNEVKFPCVIVYRDKFYILNNEDDFSYPDKDCYDFDEHGRYSSSLRFNTDNRGKKDLLVIKYYSNIIDPYKTRLATIKELIENFYTGE